MRALPTINLSKKKHSQILLIVYKIFLRQQKTEERVANEPMEIDLAIPVYGK